MSPSLSFLEGHKSSNSTTTSTSRMIETPVNAINSLNVVLVNNDSNVIADGCRVKLERTFDNKITDFDAKKTSNLDEEVAILSNNTKLSIECRSLPVNQESIPLSISKFRATNYTLRVTKNGHEPLNAVLFDHFLNKSVELNSGVELEYIFQVDQGKPESINENRFEILMSNEKIVIDESVFQANTIDHSNKVYISPNPVGVNAELTVQNWHRSSGKIVCEAINSIGQKVFEKEVEFENNTIKVGLDLPKGIYKLILSDDSQKSVTTIIVK